MSSIHASRNASVKQNLFRFVHLRDIKINTDDSQSEHVIIQHPNQAQSVFLSAIDGLTDTSAIKTALEQEIQSFTPYTSYKDVNNLNGDMTKFSAWLIKKRNKLKKDELTTAITNLAAYTGAQEISLWDNLFYQALTNQSTIIRDSILRLLQANHFFNKIQELQNEFAGNTFTASQRKFAAKIARSRVMIPAALFPKASTALNSSLISPKGNKNMEKLLSAAAVDLQVSRIDLFIQQVEEVNVKYQKTETASYNQAVATYQEDVAQAYEDAKVVDPNTGEVTYENLQLPTFSYTAANPFDQSFVTANFSTLLTKLYNKYYAGKVLSYSEILEDLEKRKGQLLQNMADFIIEPSQTINFNGSVITKSNFPDEPYLILKSVPLIEDSQYHQLVATYFHPNREVQVNEMSVDINSGSVYQGKALSKTDNTSSFVFAPNGYNAATNTNIDVEGSIKTNDNGSETFSYTQYRLGDPSPTSKTYGFEFPIDPNKPKEPTTSPYYDLDGEPGINDNLFGVKKIGIAEYKRVEQELCCYVEGEVSHIENILAREHKNKTTRTKTLTESTSEESGETEQEVLNDTTTTDRHEMQQEVSKVLEQAKEMTYGASTSVNAGYDSGDKGYYIDGTIEGHFDGTNSSSSSNTFNTSESFAKEVTERALERLVKKSSYKRTSRMLREFEDTQEHGFDNRKGDKHVTGIYRWVDKIYKNYLVNYGKRLIYEFALPEPARDWKELLKTDTKSIFIPPVEPKLLITKWEWINEENYLNYVNFAGIDVEPPPAKELLIGKSFGKTFVKQDDSAAIEVGTTFDFELPDGYECKKVRYSIGVQYHGEALDPKYIFSSWRIGTHLGLITSAFTHDTKPSTGTLSDFFDITPVTEMLPISINGSDIGGVSLNVIAKCTRTTSSYNQWQQKVFLAIKEVYNRRYEEYLEKKANYDAEMAARNADKSVKTDYNNNPLINRRIEQTELKKAAMNYMLSQTGVNMGVNFIDKDSCGHFVPIQSAGLGRYAEFIKFLEEAFDWNLMSYDFKPYYWAACTEWKNLLNSVSSSDALFEAFLQAGFAGMKVPVRGGYEKAVLFFLDTGRIWKEGDVLIEDLDRIYLSVDEDLEIKELESCCDCPEDETTDDECPCGDEEEVCIEAKWISRVPTSLTVVQDYAAPLQANGLPCFDKNDPRVKFCEDGTPIASLTPDANNPNNGLLVGGNNELDTNAFMTSLQQLMQAGTPILLALSNLFTGNNNGANNCESIMADYQAQADAYTSTMSDYNSQAIDCTTAISQLTDILSQLNTILSNAQNNGCDTGSIESTIANITSDKGDIEAVCL